MKKGLFIMIEGIDGSGKGTQTDKLEKRLIKEGHKIKQISFPQYGERSCTMVEDYLNGKFGSAEDVGPYKASIFFAIDRYAAKEKIEKWLEEGNIVIANRYVGSNMGHQGGKIINSEERNKYFEWNYHLEYTIFDIPKPDVNIILHVTPEMSQKLVDAKSAREYLQGKKRDIHEDDINHLRQAEQAYLEIAKSFKEFTIIRCMENNEMLSIEKIHEKIWNILKPYINS